MITPDVHEPDPRRFLPLTPIAFEILLALAGDARHGYGVKLEVERSSHGTRTIRPGTLYRAIKRLLDQGLLAETPDRNTSSSHDHRRRYYRLTTLGRRVAAAEARRLEHTVEAARAKKLVTAVLTGN